jgi:hypothetical protein
MEENSELRDVFTSIFKRNGWGNDESVSGAGSALASPSVLDSVKSLDFIIREWKIKTLNDAPCGDFYWMPLILGRFPRIEYRGFDIVSEMIEWNKQRYPDYDFQTTDVTINILPQADLIFCKDLILHLRDKDVAATLRNFKRSRSRFLLITNMTGCKNSELNSSLPGDFRHIDLLAEPYNFPTPIWSSNYLALWSLDAIDEASLPDL